MSRTIGWAMLLASILGFVALCSGCGGPHTADRRQLEILNGSSDVTNEELLAIIDLTMSVAHADVDLTNGTLVVLDSLSESRGYCKGAGDACTDAVGRNIHTAWDTEFAGFSKAKLNAELAVLLAHELGHVRLYQETGDADGTHSHGEWFDRSNAGSVVSLVYTEVRANGIPGIAAE